MLSSRQRGLILLWGFGVSFSLSCDHSKSMGEPGTRAPSPLAVTSSSSPDEPKGCGYGGVGELRSSVAGPQNEPTLLWQLALGSPLAGPMRFSNIGASTNMLWVHTRDGLLHRIDHVGKVRFKKRVGRKPRAGFELDRAGRVYVPMGDGKVEVIERDRTVSRLSFGARLLSAPLLTEDGYGYFPSRGIVVLGMKKGFAHKPVSRKLPVAGHIRSTLVQHPDGFVVFATETGRLLGVDHDATIRLDAKVGSSASGGPSIGPEGNIYLGTDLGDIVSYRKDGEERFRYRSDGPVRGGIAFLGNGTAVAVSTDGRVLGLGKDGALRFSFSTAGPIVASPCVSLTDQIFVGSRDNYLYALSPQGREVWSYHLGQDPDFSILLRSDGVLIVATEDGTIRALGDDESGQRKK